MQSDETSVAAQGGGMEPTDKDPPEALVHPLVGCPIAVLERALILQTLRRCGGNRTQAALMLGVSVRTIHNKLRRWHPRPRGKVGEP